MNAEQYLERIKKIDEMIRNKKEDHQRWVEIAEGLGGFSVGDKVQSSRNLRQIPDAIGRYIDIEQEINDLEQERQRIIKTIEKLPIDEYKILYGIYVKDSTMKDLVYSLGMSYSWVKQKKKEGLERIQSFL